MASSDQNNRDEIDLIVLFQKIYNKIEAFILGLFNLLITLVVFIIKKIHYLVIAAIIGGIVGFVFYKSSKKYFTSDLIARSNGITNADMIGYLNDLSKLCKENNYLSLASLLSVDDTTSSQIRNIEAFWIVDVNKDNIGDYVDFNKTFDVTDTTKQYIQDRFYLTVELFDNNTFTEVREGLYKYIRKNPYLLKLNRIRLENLKELISLTEREIKKLDSLQNTEYFNYQKRLESKKDGQISFFTEKQTQLYYKDKLELVANKQFYEKELELSNEPITIIKDFTLLAKEENPLSKFLKLSIPVFISLELTILLMLKKRNIIMGYFKKVI